jgi:multiple sugar transport system substrate-binding protein
MEEKMRKTKLTIGVATVALASMLLAGCGSSFGLDSGDTADSNPTTATDTSQLTNDSSNGLTVMIGSSGQPETDAMNAAVAAWSKQSGVSAKVVAASDLNQELAQGFASGSPADVFYLAPSSLAGYADAGNLLDYGSLVDSSDYYPSVLQSLTYKGKLYGLPKDVSTLQLVINTDMWSAAGLTEADYPTTWEQLETVAQKLTTGDHVGLSMSGQWDRIGVFFLQAGGGLISADGKTAIANTDESMTGLNEVKKLIDSGSTAFAADLGTGWGGEAFGTGKAAMTIEGNWLIGGMNADYPDINYAVIPLPAGPDGKQATQQFTNGWGIAAKSKDQKDALDLVKYLTTTDTVMDFAKAFGVMPAMKSAADQWKQANPTLGAFMDGLPYSVADPTNAGFSDVMANFDSQIGQLKSSDPKTILDSTQTNLEAIVG